MKNKCPFKIGDEVLYCPSNRGHVYDNDDLLEIGKKYKVSMIEQLYYVVVEGYNHPGGGIYWTKFKKASDT